MWAGRVLRAAPSAAPRGRRALSALTQLRGVLEEELDAIRGAGTWKSERVITSRQGPRIHVDGVSGGNRPPLGVVGAGRGSLGPCGACAGTDGGGAAGAAPGGWPRVAAGTFPDLSG